MSIRKIKSDLEKLDYLASCDPDMQLFLRKNHPDEIYHVDEKCGIFSIPQLPEGEVLKYVIERRGRNNIQKLTPALERKVLEGLEAQMFVQDIEGIQVLKRLGFFDGINGLLGPFEYLNGNKLSSDNYNPSPEYVLGRFKEIDRTLGLVHEAGVVHCDIKPGNIIDAKGKYFIIDWSIARFILSNPGTLMVTLRYYYPHDDRSLDYWALSIAFLETLGLKFNIHEDEFRDAPDDFVHRMQRRLTNQFGKNSDYRSYYLNLANRSNESLPLDEESRKKLFEHIEKMGHRLDEQLSGSTFSIHITDVHE